ncbi:MAG: alpha/beta hydrolase [Gammaproteobacteria bacterium]|jgi:pimeloyl-ACP methyl ester carboxylesterase|nr:alpha/beta hydrolase [Gammaproteobacteria bacterium]
MNNPVHSSSLRRVWLGLAICLAATAQAEPAGIVTLPFLTTRDVTLTDDGGVEYTNDTGALTAGQCSVELAQKPALTASNLAIRTLPVASVMAGLGPPERGIVVYIHGYNISIDRACRDAARFAHRAALVERLLLFSWPASSMGLTYFKDEARLASSVPALVGALNELGARYGFGHLTIAAHSMGSRIALQLGEVRPPGQRFDNLLLIASDIDRAVFASALPQIQQQVRRITLLVSDADKLLLLSQAVNRAERLGQAVDFSAPGVTVVDVSDFDNPGISGHEYHLDSQQVGAMLEALLSTAANKPPAVQ